MRKERGCRGGEGERWSRWGRREVVDVGKDRGGIEMGQRNGRVLSSRWLTVLMRAHLSALVKPVAHCVNESTPLSVR